MTHYDPISPVSPEEESAALEWLKDANGWGVTAAAQANYKATIRRLLARPVLPPEPTPEMLSVMRQEWWRDSGSSYDVVREIYRALHVHLTSKPVDHLDEIRRWGT